MSNVLNKPMILGLLAFAQLIIAIDYTIVFVAVPDIGRELGFAPHNLQWVVSGYAVRGRPGAQPGVLDLGRCRRQRDGTGLAARRCPDAGVRLAGDLLRERSARGCRGCRRIDADPG